ncbi:MAG TPA: poly(R)-hydroxyalkanoic acid synthase subunit PhaE, partial [Bacteroidia bacterium]
FNTVNMKDVFDASMKNIHEFFTNNNNLSKEYYAQMQNISKDFPNLISGDFAKVSELFNNVNNVFGKTFEPLMKLATPGKEKETIEANIALLDKIAEYSVKQTELQYHFYTTSQKAMEAAAKTAFEKMKEGANVNDIQGFNEFYNEWVKVNEAQFTELFGSDDFSKLKGEVMNIGMDVKSHFEKQFENVFGVYPVAFRSEVDELTKTIHDLKRQVKTLETRLAAMGAANIELDEEDKNTRKKK